MMGRRSPLPNLKGSIQDAQTSSCHQQLQGRSNAGPSTSLSFSFISLWKVGMLTSLLVLSLSRFLKSGTTLPPTKLAPKLEGVAYSLYCTGPLLEAVQLSLPEDLDSKDFVDRPMKFPPAVILTSFALLQDHSYPTMQKFVEDHFHPPDYDLLPIKPMDYDVTPPFRVRNASYTSWATELHTFWPELTRTIRPSLPAEQTSLLSTVDSLFVVPGGRFREVYYWDSYWIIVGLLVSGMDNTAMRVVNNFIDQVEKYGFIPNGNRVYYLDRSQPPLLFAMVDALENYWNKKLENEQHVDDMNELSETRQVWRKRAWEAVAKEYEFWMTYRVINIQGQTLNQYKSLQNHPRPESYREDRRTADEAAKRAKKMEKILEDDEVTNAASIYEQIRAGAESGWDFSSRWLFWDENKPKLTTDKNVMGTIFTMDIVPVDLNAILYRVEMRLKEWYLSNGESSEVRRMENALKQRKTAFDTIFWNSTQGRWMDWNTTTQDHSHVVSAASYMPLWVQAWPEAKVGQVLASFEQSGLLQAGGVLTSTVMSGEQWDSPNVWPPIQYFIAEGLKKQNTEEATNLAKDIEERFVQNAFKAWQQSGYMFEKYNGFKVGQAGGGGEYEIQVGFGWTNGLLLKWLTEE